MIFPFFKGSWRPRRGDHLCFVWSFFGWNEELHERVSRVVAGCRAQLWPGSVVEGQVRDLWYSSPDRLQERRHCHHQERTSRRSDRRTSSGPKMEVEDEDTSTVFIMYSDFFFQIRKKNTQLQSLLIAKNIAHCLCCFFTFYLWCLINVFYSSFIAKYTTIKNMKVWVTSPLHSHKSDCKFIQKNLFLRPLSCKDLEQIFKNNLKSLQKCPKPGLIQHFFVSTTLILGVMWLIKVHQLVETGMFVPLAFHPMSWAGYVACHEH